MAKLTEHGQTLNAVVEKLDELRRAQESLTFCAEVFQLYTTGGEAANEHMDADKARNQLLDSIFRILQV